jgi:hypothetical protein
LPYGRASLEVGVDDLEVIDEAEVGGEALTDARVVETFRSASGWSGR